MTSIRVEPDGEPPVDLLSGGSRITADEDSAALLPIVISKLRAANRLTPAREISLAITHAEEALHWLLALNRRRPS